MKSSAKNFVEVMKCSTLGNTEKDEMEILSTTNESKNNAGDWVVTQKSFYHVHMYLQGWWREPTGVKVYFPMHIVILIF